MRHRLHCLIPAIGIARVIRLAHAADEMRGAPPVGECAGESEENQIAGGDKGCGQTVFAYFDCNLACKCRFGNRSECIQPYKMILTKPGFPFRFDGDDFGADLRAHVEFDTVALAVIETDRFDAHEAVKRPGEANGGILPAGK